MKQEQEFNLEIKRISFRDKAVEIVNLLPERLDKGILIPLEILDSMESFFVTEDNYIRNLSIQVGNSKNIDEAKSIMLQAIDYIEFMKNFNIFKELNYQLDEENVL